ncbi:hypothetical protein EV127DRAFT_71175 [Xylaria flabelliformis]|nr:hypothetical protein EV127DRAFT_71175 [Xylaria flabelliformis]
MGCMNFYRCTSLRGYLGTGEFGQSGLCSMPWIARCLGYGALEGGGSRGKTSQSNKCATRGRQIFLFETIIVLIFLDRTYCRVSFCPSKYLRYCCLPLLYWCYLPAYKLQMGFTKQASFLQLFYLFHLSILFYILSTPFCY